MAAHQAPPSLGFSRQEPWSGLPFPSPTHEVKSESEVTQSCPTLSDPIDRSLPGSSVQGIFQARLLEWGAIAFSSYTLIMRKQKEKLRKQFHSPLQRKEYISLYIYKEKAMAPHSSTLTWKIPWTEEPGMLQSMGSLRVGQD